MRINIDRLMADINALAQIGRTPDGGVSRVAMSENDVAGRDWFRQAVKSAGLQFRADGAGNLSAVLSRNADKTILMGSHLDSVPNGGRFDGALGVLGALEVVRTLKEHDMKLPYNFEAISFTDEESAVFSMLGSRAITKSLSVDSLMNLPNQAKFDEGIKLLNITPGSILNASRDDIHAFLEVHIEQGSRLEEQYIDIGIVPSIVGIRTFQLTFIGQAAHAGTMPMDRRRDALWGVTHFIQQGRQAVVNDFTPGVMNVGQVELLNSASNIVPAQVVISLEFRHGTTAALDEMQTRLLQLARNAADEHQLNIQIEQMNEIAPAEMSQTVVAALESAANKLELSHISMFSFAGHDSQTMARRFPTGMFFVPSVNGISHNPQEFTKQADVENAANMLLQTVLTLAEE